jgi:hypothetical protein
MQQVQQLVERYVAVWNETDPAARRRAIEQLWTPDGEHYVKTTEVRGHDALERRIRDSHDKNVARGGNRFRAACNIQELRDVVTFNWEMIRDDRVLATGLEFLVLDPHGRIQRDYQFIIS